MDMTAAYVTHPAVASDPWWDYARGCAQALAQGIEPAPITVYGPIFDEDEQPRICTTTQVSRLLGGDGTYAHTSLLMLGNPAVTIGALAAQGVINHRRRRHARRDLMPQWRHRHAATVVVTDQRLMCSAADGTMVDFWFTAITEFYPDLATRSVVFAFGDECAPLRFDGPAAPALALWSAVGLYGPRWVDDVRLAPLVPPDCHGRLTERAAPLALPPARRHDGVTLL